MDPVSIFLLVVSAILLVGIVGELAFARTGIPPVLWLLGLGLLLGPGLGLVDRELLFVVAPHFAALALVVVLFDGGIALHLDELPEGASRAALLAGLGFVVTAAAVAPATMVGKLVGVVPASWTWMHAIMVGTILGGSSAVVILPALRRARIAAGVTRVVAIESALTDLLAVVTTYAILQIMAHRSGVGGEGSAAMALVKTSGIGIGMGAVAGLLGVAALRQLKEIDYAYALVLGGLFLLHVAVDAAAGSSPLAVVAAAVMIGNAPSLSEAFGQAARLDRRRGAVHAPITFVIKSFFFTFMGAMIGGPRGAVGLGALLAVVLLAARAPVVALGTMRDRASVRTRGLVAFLFPRGMAAGALAVLPLQLGIPETRPLVVIVFTAIATSIAVFALGFPFVRRRLEAEGLVGKAEDADSWRPPPARPKRMRRGKGGLAMPAAPPPPPGGAGSGGGEAVPDSGGMGLAETRRPPRMVEESDPEPDTAFPLRRGTAMGESDGEQ